MEFFTYHNPTELLFGKGAETRISEVLVKDFGAKKALILFGKGSAKRTGLLDRVEASAKEAGLEFVELGGVQPNPTIEFVREA